MSTVDPSHTCFRHRGRPHPGGDREHPTIGVVVALAAAVTLLCVAGPAVLIGGAVTAGCPPAATTSTGAPPPAAGWDTEQVTNAQVIITVGVRKAVPPRGWIIAIAAAMQESGRRNLPAGDRDSIGLFQQRPSQGWGTPDQLADPAYAAGKSYDKLLAVNGWPSMPVSEAAQRVQVSAYPDAYATWEDDATILVSQLTGGLVAHRSRSANRSAPVNPSASSALLVTPPDLTFTWRSTPATPATEANAVDPVAFLRGVGPDLTTCRFSLKMSLSHEHVA